VATPTVFCGEVSLVADPQLFCLPIHIPFLRVRDFLLIPAGTKTPGHVMFRGTRVPVQVLFDYLEGGETLEDFLEGFPTVSRESAVAALEEAKQLLLARP
jgi:uncharacterized protein (DUF433 family)